MMLCAQAPGVRSRGGWWKGALRDGEPHGRGVFTSNDGDKYAGEMQAGKSHVLATFPLVCWSAQRTEQSVPAQSFLESLETGFTMCRGAAPRRRVSCAAR